MRTEDTSPPALVVEKLAAFDQIQTEFEAGFRFVQDVHGQRRIEPFPIAETVRYLASLWFCDLKDRLLSVPRTIERYEGRRALELLLAWQEEDDAASVVDFLHDKLNMLPFGLITRELQAVERQDGHAARAQRLAHGRQVMLNRAFNLHYALDAIFALAPRELAEVVRATSAHVELAPAQIRERLIELASPLYSPFGHPALARRNMLVMNALGVRVTEDTADQPGHRTDRVARPTVPAGPYAEIAILGELELVPPARGTAAYMPGDVAQAAVINTPDAPPEPTGEIEQHPTMPGDAR